MTHDTIRAGGLTPGYRELGSDPAVLLVHGWPTSSFLWRNVMVPIAERNRAIALDLPDFGASDKQLHTHCGFEYFPPPSIPSSTRSKSATSHWVAMTSAARSPSTGRCTTHCAPHGSYCSTRSFIRSSPMRSPNFVRTARTPGPREGLASDEGLAQVMRPGLANQDDLTDELFTTVAKPFAADDDRSSLADAGVGLERRGFAEIERRLPSMEAALGIPGGSRAPRQGCSQVRNRRRLTSQGHPGADVTGSPWASPAQ
jgi:hypothetical protein